MNSNQSTTMMVDSQQTSHRITVGATDNSDWPAPPYTANWYIAVIEGKRYGFLLGPYSNANDATNDMPLARRLAEQADSFSCFYTFAIANLPSHITRSGNLEKYR